MHIERVHATMYDFFSGALMDDDFFLMRSLLSKFPIARVTPRGVASRIVSLMSLQSISMMMKSYKLLNKGICVFKYFKFFAYLLG